MNPYFTPKDVDKGQRWSSDIAGKLEKSQFGLILVTKENLNAPWILFEAGALSKNVGSSHVCPILLDLKPTDLSGPLVQFQATMFEKEEIRNLLTSINNSLGESSLQEKVLESVFEKWWPDLVSEIQRILSERVVIKNEEVRSERELIEEILRLVRKGSYSTFECENNTFEKLISKPVTYDEDTRIINVWFHDGLPYEIDLDQLDSGSELMDFVFQINRKGICKPEHIKAFLDCIEQLTDWYLNKECSRCFLPWR